MERFWEGIYKAWIGITPALVECHEWMGAEWPEGCEPDGAIYYDIYTQAKDGTWGVVDGGVLGYDNGAFRNHSQFVEYLGQFMRDAGQVYDLGEKLNDEEERKFWEVAA